MYLTNKDFFDLVNILRDALRDSLPYVESAYECAFPDNDKNREVEAAAREALALADDMLPPKP